MEKSVSPYQGGYGRLLVVTGDHICGNLKVLVDAVITVDTIVVPTNARFWQLLPGIRQLLERESMIPNMYN
jgi:hypothetical protein